MGIFLSFLPWIAYWVMSGRDNHQTAAVAATVIVIFLNVRDIKRRSIKILDLGTLIFFILLTAISFSSEAEWVDHYSACLSDGAMFLISLISLVIGKPFTIQYAREQVDPKFWDTPGFYATNRTISMVWCVSFALNTVLTYLYVRHPYMIDWVIHILILVGAIKFTAWYPDFVKAKAMKQETGTVA
ncbi:MAG: hypothetical protein JW736_07720 [Deltaproteobacteria bacterium]|nr:hypothetical protein [Deltaproteobacteria bacterium]MBN2688570.1 hypothetical protein [Deltaproteobacteria bacterium]